MFDKKKRLVDFKHAKKSSPSELKRKSVFVVCNVFKYRVNVFVINYLFPNLLKIRLE